MGREAIGKEVDGKVVVGNVNHPEYRWRVDAAKYDAVRVAMLAVLPAQTPGLAFDAIVKAVKPLLSGDVFPGGEKVGWWVKTVQLDLEAKKIIARSTYPVRLYRLKANG
jgi:hypothetical protein